MKKLYRSQKDRMIGGFCGGLAEYFGIDPVMIRVIFTIALFFDGIGLLFYMVGLIIVPNNPDENSAEKRSVSTNNNQQRNIHFWGIIIVIFGIILLLRQSGWLYLDLWYDLDWSLFIGLGLIPLGLYLIYSHYYHGKYVGEEKNYVKEKTFHFIEETGWYKRKNEKIIGGVCAGISHSLKIDVSLIRILWVILAIITKGLFVVIYIILLLILPEYQEKEQNFRK